MNAPKLKSSSKTLDLFQHNFGNGQRVHRDFPFFISRFPHPSYADHRHNAYEFFFVVRGKAVHHVNGKKEELREGDLVFLNLGASHAFEVAEPGSFEIINVIFLPEIFLAGLPASADRSWKKKFLEPFYLPKHRLHPEASERSRILWVLEEILVEFREKRRNHPRVIASLMAYFFELVMRLYLAKEKPGQNASSRFLMIHTFVGEHFNEPISLSGLAAQFKMTEPYLSAAFKKNFGLSFKTFLTLKRIEYAKFLLRTSQRPVTDISFEAGFENLATFERSFKKTAGA
ncbi:MAG: helix-turn-helix domain-containing protein, partial [Spirochaetia bacterium]|nr:helix-turn-helix domain-containing protein [Spirochaetia bacterium]